MSSQKIALPVIKRLPRYYRCICALRRQGVPTVSSGGLAAMLGTTASQVRQDFNSFGGFGQQGVGYRTETLAAELENLLFSGSALHTILVGTGRLGRTISGYLASEAPGFLLVAAFDNAPAQVGSVLGGLRVRDVSSLEAFCARRRPQVAVLCIPEAAMEALSGRLLALDIKGFWNFSHYDLAAEKPGVVVENVHLGDSLNSLGYRVRAI